MFKKFGYIINHDHQKMYQKLGQRTDDGGVYNELSESI